MRARGAQVVAALLVGALTVLAPDGVLNALVVSDSLGASAMASRVDEPEPLQDAVRPTAAAGLAPTAGAVTVTVTVVGPSAPPSAVVIPIYRFYSPKSGTHFYTPSAEEREMVIARWPDVWAYEGVAYTVDTVRNSQPLYRFYNLATGSHFYTASATERDTVIARWGDTFHYDGLTYSVSPYPETGKAPVWRFYNKKNGSHFYTASGTEANHVIATWSHIYQLEGAAFWLGQ